MQTHSMVYSEDSTVFLYHIRATQKAYNGFGTLLFCRLDILLMFKGAL